MIDLVKLNEHKPLFGYMARQLSYPNPQAAGDQAGFSVDCHPAAVARLQLFEDKLTQLSPDEVEELYVQTFDFQKSTTLYMTHAKFEDSRERGAMIATLKSIYEMYGLEIADNELADYLPLMCEFLGAAQWLGHPHAEESFKTLFAVLEDGTYELLKALENIQSPYYELVKALRDTFKLCLRQEVIVHGHD